jgi:hypothetical protein
LRFRLTSTLVCAGVLLMAMQGVLSAQTILEQLVMPGPLVQGHAKYEGECGKCHEPFSRQSQTRLCLDCHKEVAADRASRHGFHGRNPVAVKQECRHCHTDHKGREADINQLDRDTFNHAFSNFQLRGAHTGVRCEACHLPKAAFRKAPGRCFDCHKAVDAHQRRLGEQCESCHGETKWGQVKPYDHSKTKFALQGAHQAVVCATCHLGEVYKDLPSTCVSCHRLQDVHSDRYGAKCETCHDQNKWKAARFDHGKTKYPLVGAHQKVKCDACHTGDIYRDKLATTCVSCHKKDDPHKNQLGPRCEQCHSVVEWRQKVQFDHDITRFPLIGLHAPVPCEECHRSSTYKDEPVACGKCHKDQHEGRLGTGCANCHNPNGWARWRYDHATQAKYPLTGAHQKIRCEACHVAKTPMNLKLPTDCFSCHRKDDAHRGTFGQPCERCHITTDWRRVTIRN